MNEKITNDIELTENTDYLKIIAEQLTLANELRVQELELEKIRLENDLSFNRMISNFTISWQEQDDQDIVRSRLNELDSKLDGLSIVDSVSVLKK